MKNIIQKGLYSAVAIGSAASLAAFTSATGDVGKVIQLDTQNASQFWFITGDDASKGIWPVIRNILEYLLGFLWLIAVIVAIYAWFQILTAGWDEDKVKNGKSTLINALIGLFVILIAYALVSWMINAFSAI